MTHEFRLADIGEGLEEAEIISWLVKVGDQVTRDQPLIEIMTDKSNAELPAPVAGTVVSLSGAVGDIIQVGELIAIINPVSDASAPVAPTPTVQSPPAVTAGSSSPAAPAVSVAPAVSAPPAVSAIDATPAAPATSRPKASPSTRRVAAERGVDLSLIAGSGPGGRILLSDLDAPAPEEATPRPAPPAVPLITDPAPVPAAPAEPVTPVAAVTPAAALSPPGSAVIGAEADAPTPPKPTSDMPPAAADVESPVGAVPLRGIRRVIAHNMERSWSEIPHIHAFELIDAEPLIEMRGRLKETGKDAYESLTPLSFFVAAVAQALASHRQANASIDTDADTITYHNGVNVGIAVAAPRGLVVPVLRGADQLDFDTLSLTLTQLIRGARDGSLSREHFQGGTVTITNFGSLGGEQALPIIRAPESTIFGFGSIKDRPFVVEDQVVARKTMHLVVGADHRLLDGDVVTAILNQIAASLTDPLRLVL